MINMEKAHFSFCHDSNSYHAGTEILLDLWECDNAILSNGEFLNEILTIAAEKSGATVLNSYFHPFKTEEEGVFGQAGTLTLAESHITIHTWPELGYAMANVCMCGSADPGVAAEILIEKLKSRRHEKIVIRRGFLKS